MEGWLPETQSQCARRSTTSEQVLLRLLKHAGGLEQIAVRWRKLLSEGGQ